MRSLTLQACDPMYVICLFLREIGGSFKLYIVLFKIRDLIKPLINLLFSKASFQEELVRLVILFLYITPLRSLFLLLTF